MNLTVTDEVRDALASGRPVVALESTIVSHGMPYPQNVEMARTVEDVLSRRTRMLLLDARAAIAAAPKVAETLAAELGRDEQWRRSQVEAFTALARGYLLH